MTAASPDDTTLLLIRHAQSVWNTKENRLCGSTDVELLPEGLAATDLLGAALAQRPLTAIHCTPLSRSKITAEAIARHHPGLVPIVEPDLQELDYGQWEGLTYDEIKQRDPELFCRWVEDPTDQHPPDGESPREVADRAVTALNRLAETYRGQTAAIVAHNTVNRLILCTVLGIPIGRYRLALTQHNLALNEIRFTHGVPKVIHLNDTCHLANPTEASG